MKPIYKLYFYTFALMMFAFALGYQLNNLIDTYKEYDRKYNGLYLGNYVYADVRNITKDYEERGDWICVNVREMTFEEAYETCGHETGHEIFAEYCEENINKCIGLTQNES